MYSLSLCPRWRNKIYLFIFIEFCHCSTTHNTLSSESELKYTAQFISFTNVNHFYRSSILRFLHFFVQFRFLFPCAGCRDSNCARNFPHPRRDTECNLLLLSVITEQLWKPSAAKVNSKKMCSPNSLVLAKYIYMLIVYIRSIYTMVATHREVRLEL